MKNIVHVVVSAELEKNVEEIFFFSDGVPGFKNIFFQNEGKNLKNFDSTEAKSFPFLFGYLQFCLSLFYETFQYFLEVFQELLAFRSIERNICQISQ